MKKNHLWSASLICANILNLETDLRILEKTNLDYLHFDVMDGIFVPRYGMYPEILHAITSKYSIPVDVHLMVENPDPYIPIFAKAGAKILSVHIEACKHIHRTLTLIRHHNMLAGIALNPGTSLNIIDDLIETLDWVLIMAINPGILGQKFYLPILKKISRLKEKLLSYNSSCRIIIDGGVTFNNASDLFSAGADMLVGGSATIFQKNNSIQDNLLLAKTISKEMI